MSKQIIAKPQGIITEPNKVGQFAAGTSTISSSFAAGAFATGANFAIRSFGTVEQVAKFQEELTMPGVTVGGAYYATDGDDVALLVELTTRGTWYAILFHRDVSGSASSITRQVTSPWNGYVTADGNTGLLLMRNRLIVTAPIRSFVIDFYPDQGFSPTGSASGPRNTGLPQIYFINRTSQTETTANIGGVMPPNTHISAVPQLRSASQIEDYELLSPPPVPYDFANTSTTQTQTSSSWTIGTPLHVNNRPADSVDIIYVDVYRTREQSTGYDSVNNKYAPIATGSSFYKSGSSPVFSGTPLISDDTQNEALGESLLTNTSASGAAALPIPPVPSKTCAPFKGYGFYANRFDPATLVLQNPYYWGTITQSSTFSARLNGVGVRLYSGGSATSGSANVSAPGGDYTGFKIGQDFIVRRADTNAVVLNGTITGTNSGAGPITASTTSSYTGSVNLEAYDELLVNGVRVRADFSPQLFAANLSAAFGDKLDVFASGIEPQKTYDSSSTVGVYPSYVPSGGITIRLRTNDTLDVKATNGGSYIPQLTEYNNGQTVYGVVYGKQQSNAVAWSELNEPESCPPGNYVFVGKGTIFKMVPTRDCLWIFCSDGLYRLSGTGGSAADGYDWVIDPVDTGLILAGQNCAVAHREYVYAYTNRGFVSISSEGTVRPLSDGRINPSIKTWPRLSNSTWSQISDNAIDGGGDSLWVAVDAAFDDILIRFRDGGLTLGYAAIWVYNVKTDAWSFRQPSLYGDSSTPTLGFYSGANQTIFGIYAGRNKVVRTTPRPDIDPGNYEAMTFTSQPIYGGKPDGAHTQKHWQDVEITFRSPQTNSGSSITIGAPFGNVQQSRTIPTTPNGAGQSIADAVAVGFTVARNHPAMASSFTFEVTVDSPPSGGQPFAIEAISVNYIDFSDERKVR